MALCRLQQAKSQLHFLMLMQVDQILQLEMPKKALRTSPYFLRGINSQVIFIELSLILVEQTKVILILFKPIPMKG